MKKTISVLLSLILVCSMFSVAPFSVFADECEHNYELTYDYDKDNEQLAITPVCTVCSAPDETNKIVVSNFSFDKEQYILSADISTSQNNPYIEQLGVSQYISEGKITVSRTDALAFLNKISESVSDEDKVALAEKLGVDSRLLTCKHAGITDANNYSLQMTDAQNGTGKFVCPDCGLTYEIHFTISDLDFENKTMTIYIQELDRSFTVDISFFIDFIQTQFGSLISGGDSGSGGGSGGGGSGMSGLTPEQISAIMALIGGMSGGDSGSGGSGGFDISGYTGTTARPASTKIVKIKKLKKGLKVTYKKVKGVKGYQIKVSTSKKFSKKTTKTITVKGAKKTTVTIKKLKANKKYFVKVRAFTKINGKKVYSKKWSKVKTQKTK